MSARRIIGFACNQAFVFFLFYRGMFYSVDVGPFAFVRLDLAAMLLLMVVGFAFVRLLIYRFGSGGMARLFARPLLYVYAVVAAVGSLLPALMPDVGVGPVIGQGVLVGLACALLLTAWGRAFGAGASRASVPEVFLGSLVAALICLVFSLAANEPLVIGAVCFLPLASAVNIEIPADDDEAVVAAPSAEGSGKARVLSSKIIAGTFLFGMAAGIMGLSRAGDAGAVVPYYPVSMVLFGAFLIGGLSLLLSDGFGRGAALSKSYRLVVFILMVGVLLVPWPALADSVLPGEAVALAGFLGLETVLTSLFVVMAEITGDDCALTFSGGFLALFAGQFVGLLMPGMLPGSILAGVIILLSYVFLFTERDFEELSQIVSERDSFEDTCKAIAQRYGLSRRESEILVFALRGRTSERIAQELVISKSTVDTHLRRIYSKCGVHSRQELLDLANL